MPGRVIRIEPETNPALRRRLRWADSLREHMDSQMPPLGRKELVVALREIGVDVSVQAVGQWLRGETSPRLEHQAALATVLRVPVRSLFPVEALAS